MQQTWAEILTRLRPVLELIFATYGVQPLRAQAIVEDAALVLMSKRPAPQDADGWLVRAVLEKCQNGAAGG